MDFDLGKRGNWPYIALRGFLQESSGDKQKALNTYRAVRLMIRHEEDRVNQSGLSDLWRRIDIRLVKHMHIQPGWLGIKQKSLTEAFGQNDWISRYKRCFCD